MKNEAIPKIRFKGFTNNWKQKKLTDITNIYNGLTYHPKDKQKYGTWVLRSSNIQNGEIVHNDDVIVNDSIVNSPNVKPEDIIIVVRNGSKRLIGKHALVTSLMPRTVIGAFMNGFRCKNSYFLEALLGSNEFKKDVHESLGATINQLTKSDFKLIHFIIPSSSSEQQLIGKFFAKLDKLIQLQQKKVSLLKKLKRGYLQKLFPQPGTCFPSLRFKGFFKPWSCSKASTLFKSISEKNHPKLPVLSSTQTQGLVYRKDLNSDIKYNPKSLPNYKVIHKGDFVISLRSFQGGFECSNKLGIISAAYTVFNFINRFNQNTYFWKTFFKSYIFLQLLKKITFGIRDGKSIKFTGFKSLKLKYPSYKEEYKLGELFKNMNNNIDIQKNKLIQLRKLKEAYLQKMFC